MNINNIAWSDPDILFLRRSFVLAYNVIRYTLNL